MLRANLLAQESAATERGQRATQSPISDDLLNRGYHVFAGATLPRSAFRDLYHLYDAVASRLGEDPSLLTDWEGSVSAWLADPETRRFQCGVPPVFRDRHGKESKRDKDYLQFCISYAHSEAFDRAKIKDIPEVQELFAKLTEIHFRCVGLFTGAVEAICAGNRQLRDRIQPPGAFSLIVIKMLRYNDQPARFATDPHFDKSALSLLLDSDDDEVRYRVAKFEPSVRLSQFVAPLEYPVNDDVPSPATLISGLCLREIGLRRFQPSPHFVLPVTGKRRHSIVAFLLVPGLGGTDRLSTRVDFVNDFLQKVS